MAKMKSAGCAFQTLSLIMIVVFLVLVCILKLCISDRDSLEERNASEVIRWGKSFGGLAASENVKFDCTFNGHPTCCALLEPVENLGLRESKDVRRVGGTTGVCTITKQYIPSQYEVSHLAKAFELDTIANVTERKRQLISFINADIDASNIWLGRVKEHMSSENVPHTKHDLKYLSRFEITKTCTGAFAHMSSKWYEWIEPITVHARHPFSMKICPPDNVYTNESISKMKFSSELEGMDYVLLKSGHELHEATVLSRHNHTKFANHHNQHSHHRVDHIQSRNFMFDAGTSTFDSSMVWFLCAYVQRKIDFDQIYGFEYTLLEPVNFWEHVPRRIKPYYHFFNVPISGGEVDDLSPLRFIKDIANEEDFVSYKLDVDNPAVEIPQAMALLKNPDIAKLVDEFFYELHFKCEIMLTCGWGEVHIAEEYDGLKMDRSHVLQFFSELRKLGIRAHIWP